MTSSAIRDKLYNYIRVANEKKIHALYDLLEDEIDGTNDWWKDKSLVKELDSRYESLESGDDRGYTLKQLEESVSRSRHKRYGKYS